MSPELADTIVLTCNNHDNFIEFLGVLKAVFIAFLEKSLFIRGGVAYSRHFQNGRLTYSHAVARAHELESKRAIYPRIIIDENIIGMCTGKSGLPDLSGQSLLIKQNGVCFLNIVDKNNWKHIHNLSAEIYGKDKNEIIRNEAAFSKHCWFENYLFSMKSPDVKLERYIEKFEII